MAAPVPGSDVRHVAALPRGSASGGAQRRCQPSTPQQAEASSSPCTASTAAGSQPSISDSSSGVQSAPPKMSSLASDRQAAATDNPVSRLWLQPRLLASSRRHSEQHVLRDRLSSDVRVVGRPSSSGAQHHSLSMILQAYISKSMTQTAEGTSVPGADYHQGAPSCLP